MIVGCSLDVFTCTVQYEGGGLSRKKKKTRELWLYKQKKTPSYGSRAENVFSKRMRSVFGKGMEIQHHQVKLIWEKYMRREGASIPTFPLVAPDLACVRLQQQLALQIRKARF